MAEGNPEARAFAASASALGKVEQPEDIAGVVSFLASGDVGWGTGRASS